VEKILVKIIYDNCKGDQNLQEGWGFSALIEANDRKILFDTGNNQEAFFSNVEKMNINLEEVTEVMFSHKHADHTTGCMEILGKLQKNCTVYLPKGFPSKKIPSDLNTQKVNAFLEIKRDIFSLVLRAGFFLYEQILLLQIEKGLVAVTGCAHPGIVNILKAAQKRLQKPDYFVLGGFHLFRKSCSISEDIVKQFQSLGVKKVAPCHCSGEKTIELFEHAYQQNFYKIGTGSIIEIT
jgi:7,8-dihydropterin-6-yl-methyl-4-(beta-D-ribofuranosyl)aminobenzene 5'-phosphate synthase